MQLLSISLNNFIFGIFLPFLLFYVLLYALLRKSEILGKSNTLNALTSLSISALGVFSIYELGLIQYTIWIAAATILVAFIALFVFGTIGYTGKKLESYATGEAFKSEDEKKWDKAYANAQDLWPKFEKAYKEADVKGISEYSIQLSEQVKILEGLAPKLKKDLKVELPWYSLYKAVMAELTKRSGG